MSKIPGYMTAQQAAILIGVDHSQVCRYCIDKKLKAVKVGRQWMIPESEAKKFVRPPVGNPNLQKN